MAKLCFPLLERGNLGSWTHGGMFVGGRGGCEGGIRNLEAGGSYPFLPLHKLIPPIGTEFNIQLGR